MHPRFMPSGSVPVIPARSRRKQPQCHDRNSYKARHTAECFVIKTKHHRHIFPRLDKLAYRYPSLLHFESALICLR